MNVDLQNIQDEARKYAKAFLELNTNREFYLVQNSIDTALSICKEVRSDKPNILVVFQGFHFLDEIYSDNSVFAGLMDFAHNKWIIREDDFLPNTWPEISYSSCSNMLEVSLYFSWNIYIFTKEQFQDIPIQNPLDIDKTAVTFVEALNKLRLRIQINCNSESLENLRYECKYLLDREQGRYERRIQKHEVHDHLMAVKVICANFQVSPRTIYRCIKEGKLINYSDSNGDIMVDAVEVAKRFKRLSK